MSKKPTFEEMLAKEKARVSKVSKNKKPVNPKDKYVITNKTKK